MQYDLASSLLMIYLERRRKTLADQIDYQGKAICVALGNSELVIVEMNWLGS